MDAGNVAVEDHAYAEPWFREGLRSIQVRNPTSAVTPKRIDAMLERLAAGKSQHGINAVRCEAPGSAPGSWSYNKFFNGLMDEISIYNRPLSDEEIENIAKEQNHGEPLPTPTPTFSRPEFFRNFN